MRLVRFLFFYVPLSGAGAILVLFLIQNWRPVRLDLFGPQYSISLTWVLVAAMAVGAFGAAILLLPGRLAATLRAWSLERELRRCEQDIWRLQERRERLLFQHERLLEEHERMLLTHQDLVEEHSLVLIERDEARAQVDTLRALPAHQPARQPIPLARVAGASATSAAALHSPASDSPAPVALVRAETVPAPPHAVARPPTSPRSAPILLAEPPPAIAHPAPPPAAPPAATPPALPPSPHRVAVSTSVPQSPPLAAPRSRLHTDITASAATLAALRAILVARLAHLKRTLYRGKAPLASSDSGPDDPPGGDDRG